MLLVKIYSSLANKTYILKNDICEKDLFFLLVQSITSTTIKCAAGKILVAQTKEEEGGSFFSFFKDVVPEVNDNVDEFMKDISLASEIKDSIIPNAILFYTGEYSFDSDDESGEEYDDEEEDDDDEDES